MLAPSPRAIIVRVRAAAPLAFALALLGPATAHAYEDQVGLAAGLGYAVIPSDTALPQHGLAVQAEIGFGLGDTWELRALAGYAVEIADEPLHRVHLGAELVYLLDILEVVPFFGVGIDLPLTIHPLVDRIPDFAGHAVVGIDWLLSRDFALGVEVRPYVLFTRLDADAPVWLTTVIRAQVLFEI